MNYIPKLKKNKIKLSSLKVILKLNRNNRKIFRKSNNFKFYRIKRKLYSYIWIKTWIIKKQFQLPKRPYYKNYLK